MSVTTRRATLFGLLGLLATPLRAEEFPVEPNSGYDAWVARFRARALKRGIAAGVLDTAFLHAGFLPGVIEKDRSQAESIYGLEDYLAITVSDARVAMGRQVLQTRRGLLARIEAAFGVEARVVAAIWGVESSKISTRRPPMMQSDSAISPGKRWPMGSPPSNQWPSRRLCRSKV